MSLSKTAKVIIRLSLIVQMRQRLCMIKLKPLSYVVLMQRNIAVKSALEVFSAISLHS